MAESAGRTCTLEVDMDDPAALVGNSFGYSLLQQAIYAGLLSRGVTIRRGAPLRLQVVSPGLVRPAPGATNVVMTMWENYEMEEPRVANLRLADHLIVPSNFCQDAFSRFGLRTVRCPLGIYPERWPYQKRAWDGSTTFRWLWVGAPNPRKGWDVIEDAWQPFRNLKNVELYLKTTGTDRPEEVVRRGNAIVDNRRIDHAELLALYHSAHAFVFPTAGEGWGLTLQEAMATGLPVIATKYSGHLDFCDASVAAMVGYEDARARFAADGLDIEGLPPVVAVREQVAESILAVMKDYPRAVARARIGAQRVRRFTWDRTVDTLLWNLRRMAGRASP